MHRCRRTARRFTTLWLLLAAAALAGPAVAGADTTVDGMSLWKQNAEPVAWTANPNRVYYSALGSDGMYEGYSAAPDGSDVSCLTCSAPSFPGAGTATQRGVSDVSADGRYMLLEVENPHHLGTVGGSISEPGKGAFCDVWLASSDGSQMWPLTDVTAAGSGVIGTMWARFNPAGNQVVFAEMYGGAFGSIGYWRLVVASIVWNGGVPSLADEHVIEPASGLFMEPYGFTPDGQHVIFSSDYGQSSWTDSQIWEASLDGSSLTQLSPGAQSGLFASYNEFAFFTPSGAQIVYGRTADSSASGIDYWVMNADGSGSQRLTYLNEPWSSENLGYAIVGSLAFNPENPNQFIAAVARSLDAPTQDAVLVTLGSSGAGQGLTAEFFAGAQTLESAPLSPGTWVPSALATTVDDPSSGFEASGAPAPGVAASDYSARWTGSIVPPSSGTYALCVTADAGARLYAGGALLINAPVLFGQRSCAPLTAAAGQPIPIELDYWHGQGDAHLQLTWIPPGAAGALSATTGGDPDNWSGNAATGEVIPAADLQPGTPPPSGVAAGPAAAPSAAPAPAPGSATGSGAAPAPAGQPSAAKGGPTATAGGHTGGAVARIARAHKRKPRRVCKRRKHGKRVKCKRPKRSARRKRPGRRSHARGRTPADRRTRATRRTPADRAG